jgi:hypothetical protein
LISLELAKRLKEAGLTWEPQIGDMFYWHNGKDWEIDALTSEDVNGRLDETRDFIEEGFWILAPRLDQLLAEIEKRGFIWALDVSATNGNKVIGYAMNIATSLDWEDEEEFRSDSPEEAAASALLWILEGGTSK